MHSLKRNLAYRKEEVTNVMRDVYGQAHVSEVKAVTKPNQCQRHDMVPDQLLEILARFFQPKDKHYKLLGPIACLQKIICLEQPFVRSVGEPFIHSHGVKIPNWSPAHDEKTKGPKHCEVYGSVCLFHETILFCAGSDAVGDCRWT